MEQAFSLASVRSESVPDELRELLHQALSASEKNDITIQKQEENIQLQDETIQLQDERIKALIHRLFGRRSEKSKYIMDGQIVMSEVYGDMFDEAEVTRPEEDAEPASIKPTKQAKRKEKRRMEETFKHLPVEEKIYRFPEGEKICADCGGELTSVGIKHNRFEIEVIPAKITVYDIKQETCQCPACTKEKGHSVLVSPPTLPVPVLQHSFASPSAITHVMTQKFEQHVPLYRQINDWSAMGLDLDRSTLSSWVVKSSEEWLYPIVTQLTDELRTQTYLHADETPVQVLKEPGRDNTQKSYMWVFASAKHCRHPVRLFHYSATRASSTPEQFLKGFRGYLLTDDYAGYNGLKDVTRAGCWAHVRRKFVEVPAVKGARSARSTAQKGVSFCNELFKLEREYEGMSPVERYQARLERSVPVIDKFWAYVDEHLATVSLKSKLGRALLYADHNRERLKTFLQDGHLEISNAMAENAIRPFAIGRKNWLFSGSPDGATASACIYSLIETAKANGLVPRMYIQTLLAKIPGSDYLSNPNTMSALMPWSSEIQASCRKKTSANPVTEYID